ncbi:MAG TPA: nucleoside triphosphate pyrophosphohydrolase [bacterium]|jgi:tetrapyrrole methylase family protein/MazG family protein|nr:nucleoside triphosphate pyrophosphohydrolase [bacterium]
MNAPYTFDDLVRVMARLRGPAGCPWDKEQTPRSLRPYLLEEAYETLDAIDRGDDGALRDELGDLLLQVVFHAQMAAEKGRFNAAALVDGLVRKLIERHPHVFGEARLPDAAAVLAHWEERKAARRGSLFEGIPETLPALVLAQKVQERARATGFQWPDAQSALAKVRDELGELEAAAASGATGDVADELGDLFFTLINIAIFYNVDAEITVRDATRKFLDRFTRVQTLADASGRALADHSLDELLALWAESKRG